MRRAGVGDAEAITAVTRAAYAQWVPLIGREPMPMTVDYAMAVRDHLIDVMDQDGVVIALIEMMPRSDHLWIENIAVDPPYQGRGLGQRLLSHAEEVARGLGLSDLRLLTNEAFAANLRFYKKLGFVQTAREPFRGGFTIFLAKPL